MSSFSLCATCPLHHGYQECQMIMLENDMREAGTEVTCQ